MSSQGPAAAFADPIDVPRRRRTWLVPGVLLVLLIAMLAAIVIIAQLANDDGTPPRPGEFVLPASTFPTVPYDIQQRSEDGSLTIAATDGATFDVRLDDIAVEILEPIEIGDIGTGERVSFIGYANEVRNFVILSVVVFEAGADIAAGDAGYRSAAGFQGWEAARDQTVRPIAAGVVVAAADGEVVLDTAVGELTLRLAATEDAAPTPIYRLRADPELVIDAGDRLALSGVEGGDPETADAALVQPAR
jgi:hypothetical protein